MPKESKNVDERCAFSSLLSSYDHLYAMYDKSKTTLVCGTANYIRTQSDTIHSSTHSCGFPIIRLHVPFIIRSCLSSVTRENLLLYSVHVVHYSNQLYTKPLLIPRWRRRESSLHQMEANILKWHWPWNLIGQQDWLPLLWRYGRIWLADGTDVSDFFMGSRSFLYSPEMGYIFIQQ